MTTTKTSNYTFGNPLKTNTTQVSNMTFGQPKTTTSTNKWTSDVNMRGLRVTKTGSKVLNEQTKVNGGGSRVTKSEWKKSSNNQGRNVVTRHYQSGIRSNVGLNQQRMTSGSRVVKQGYTKRYA